MTKNLPGHCSEPSKCTLRSSGVTTQSDRQLEAAAAPGVTSQLLARHASTREAQKLVEASLLYY